MLAAATFAMIAAKTHVLFGARGINARVCSDCARSAIIKHEGMSGIGLDATSETGDGAASAAVFAHPHRQRARNMIGADCQDHCVQNKHCC